MNALRPAGRFGAGRFGAGLVVITLVIAACSSGGSAGASTPPSSAPSAAPSTPPDAVVTSPPNGAGVDPLPGDPSGGFVVAKPGQLDLHPVAIDSFAARVDGTTITVTLTWTSGVEPCNTLDHVLVDPSSGTYTITIFEGHGPELIMCVELAQIKRYEFEIPAGHAGTYTLVDGQGRATPLEVKIP